MRKEKDKVREDMNSWFGDKDKDGIINMLDCNPTNPNEDGWFGDALSTIKQKVFTPVIQEVKKVAAPVYKKVVAPVVKKVVAPVVEDVVDPVVQRVVFPVKKRVVTKVTKIAKPVYEEVKRVVIRPTVYAKKVITPTIKVITPVIRTAREEIKSIPVARKEILPKVITKAKEVTGYYPEKQKAQKETVLRIEKENVKLASTLGITSRVRGSGKKAIVVNDTRYVEGKVGFNEALSHAINQKLTEPIPMQPTRELQTHKNKGAALLKTAKAAGWVDASGVVRYPDNKAGNTWAKKYDEYSKKDDAFATSEGHYKDKYFEYTPQGKRIVESIDISNKLVTQANKQAEEREKIERRRGFGLAGKYEDVEEKYGGMLTEILPEKMTDRPEVLFKMMEIPVVGAGAYGYLATKAKPKYRVGQFYSGMIEGAYEEAREKPVKFVATTAAFAALPAVTKGIGLGWGGIGAGKALPRVTKHAPKAIGYGLGGVYAGSVGWELGGFEFEDGKVGRDALTAEEEGKIIGRTSVELAAMGLGYGVGKAALPPVTKAGKEFLRLQKELIADTSASFPRKDPMIALKKKWAAEKISIDRRVRTGAFTQRETTSGVIIEKTMYKGKAGEQRRTGKTRQKGEEHKTGYKARREQTQKEIEREIARRTRAQEKVLEISKKKIEFDKPLRPAEREIARHAKAKEKVSAISTQAEKQLNKEIQILFRDVTPATGLLFMPISAVAHAQLQKERQIPFQRDIQLQTERDLEKVFAEAALMGVTTTEAALLEGTATKESERQRETTRQRYAQDTIAASKTVEKVIEEAIEVGTEVVKEKGKGKKAKRQKLIEMRKGIIIPKTFIDPLLTRVPKKKKKRKNGRKKEKDGIDDIYRFREYQTLTPKEFLKM